MILYRTESVDFFVLVNSTTKLTCMDRSALGICTYRFCIVAVLHEKGSLKLALKPEGPRPVTVSNRASIKGLIHP